MNNEPVAWMVNDKIYQDIFEAEHYSKFTNKPMIPRYTHPAAQQRTIEAKFNELTDEEILNLFEHKYDVEIDDEMLIDFARAILRKAQEK